MNADLQINEQNLQEAERISALFTGFMFDSLTDKQKEDLKAWVHSTPENENLFRSFLDKARINKEVEWLEKAGNKKPSAES